ncbi:MAG: glycosyltransferase, partial [Parabacteroides sp.]|nr:glycosyltransferase [Parabacteroides sp.]
MKILLVTRGSQGDVFPYLTIATALVKRGHSVTLNVPRFFEKEVQAYGIPYTLQAFDDIQNVMKEKTDTTSYLKWIRNVIDSQFQQLIPLLQEHDLLVSTNSEFAAASVAEYCGKPFIRTAYAPLIPGNKIPPPL